MDPLSPLEQPALPIVIVQGETFYLPVTYNDDQGNPIDLTGYTAKMQVRQTADAIDPPIIEASTPEGNGYIVLVPLAGQLFISIPADVTDALVEDTDAVYDIFINSSGVSERLLYGPVTIIPRVTK